ncbi:MAG TPA: inositol monophosphatase [Patescibacteria group bacterium]|nr:inositol monophosphatase [Patescibacteria group bacterium]
MIEELDFAKRIAKEAGAIILKDFSSPNVSLKIDGSPLTATDMAINKIVIDQVAKHFPNHSVKGEEKSLLLRSSTHTWVCDPIDGTLPYTLGIPTCVFSLALLNSEGKPIVAVVYDPFEDRYYYATLGGGAFMNETKLSVNHTEKVEDALIGNSGRSSEFIYADKFKTYLYQHSYRPIILHSVIYEAMLVASGKIAATVMTGDAPHDAASAKLIVEEAGGTVTDLFGSEQRYDDAIRGAIISNGAIHADIISLAQKYRLNI